MKKTIAIDDNIQEIIDDVIDEVKTALFEYLDDNPDIDETPCISNDLDYSGRIHEIIDGAVPIYTSDINDIFYLYGDEMEAAFDNAGMGNKDDKWPCGWKAAAIYCYIQQEVFEWYQNNADDIFKEWKEQHAN